MPARILNCILFAAFHLRDVLWVTCHARFGRKDRRSAKFNGAWTSYRRVCGMCCVSYDRRAICLHTCMFSVRHVDKWHMLTQPSGH